MSLSLDEREYRQENGSMAGIMMRIESSERVSERLLGCEGAKLSRRLTGPGDRNGEPRWPESW